jgi:hypothetical protein
MGFFSGRLTCTRFRIDGTSPRQFDQDHLAQLSASAIDQAPAANAQGVSVGWLAGSHILDSRFELEKNIISDCLHFALRIDSQKVPSDLLRAYTQVELDALAAENPSGRPSIKQKREAKQAARDRLEMEASDGRYLRRKMFPLLWDCQSNELLVGTTSIGAIDHLLTLFQKTFDLGLEYLGAGRQAFLQAEARNQSRNVDDASLSPYIPGTTGADVAWCPDEMNRDFLGNEFLLWLWYVLDQESDSIALADKSEVTVMMTRSLTLECPRGQTGKESIQSDAPTRLPEARRAIQAGKLPRKTGLILVRHDQQYELTLQGESLAISGAKLPLPEGESDRARLDERVSQIRHFLETVDLVYDAFGSHRFSNKWSVELAEIQKWLGREERKRRTEAG